ncbi:MAG: class IIb bacteriocin, lactobin A/cerein 7B family [Pseudomonadales bacterium]
MRELTSSELNHVSGGIAPWAGAAAIGFAQGAFTAGASSYLSGASWQSTVGSAALGGLAGAAGGIAGATTGVIRAVNSFRSMGLGVAAGTFSNGQNGVRSISDMEKEPEQ